MPRGAQRGTDAVLLFNGGRLADVQEVLPYYPGIAVKKFEVVSDAQLKVTVTVAADCRLGEHAFRVRTATGVSDLRTFWVGALPSVDERELNSQFESPQPITLNTTVHGVIDNEDVDYFVVECKKGQRLAVEIEGLRLGEQFWDPYVAILDAKRFELATSDDSSLLGQDAGCAIVVPADGKYVVQVRESAYGGNGGCHYRLHVGTFPRPTAVVPAGGKPGEELEVRFVGDPAGEIKQKIKLPAAADAQFRVHCQTPDGISPTGFKFRVADLPGVVESGANITSQAATPGTAPGAFHGVVSKPGETKYFKFAAKKGQVFDIHCYARRLGSPLDPVMYVGHANNGAVIAANDDAVGPDSYIRFTAPEDKEYLVWVHDHLKKGAPDYFFRIELSPVAASTSTGIPKVDGNNVSNQDRQVVAVPKGNRFATMVNVNRADWGGPAVVGFDALPAGLAFAAEPVEPGLAAVPVVFEAKADAPTGGRLADLRATPADPKVAAATSTNLDVNFCIGLNNTPFHRLYTDRLAIAVTDAAPYSIEVIEPKAPVLQNGSMNLKVVAKRAAGFKGPITVFPLFTPPGMGIQGSAVIPENATETVLPMNAAGNAAARKWKTAVTAVGDAGKGPVWVSSQLFTLEVAPPFVALAQERAAVEQGKVTPVFCKVTVATPFQGEAVVRLLGLPAKATTPELKITKDTKDVTFNVTTEAGTPAGKHGLFCQVVITHNGESLAQSAGGNELRVDVPLSPKPAAVAAKPATPAPAQPAAPAQPKRLSRLEQLRLDQEEREKAAKAGQPAPAPKADAPKK
ncbi:putative serine proteinase, subtilase family [Fimbriiglobus ruber]|uniref:Putative serine proteinase, subtilase family n=2 Tax=Fimbriiglobus ruber TaxID=1908690 RepID=A0A225DJT9_9BACT|nr:putative serine proteinase, subtilase family [Fimbriiglobus ruber]